MSSAVAVTVEAVACSGSCEVSSSSSLLSSDLDKTRKVKSHIYVTSHVLLNATSRYREVEKLFNVTLERTGIDYCRQ